MSVLPVIDLVLLPNNRIPKRNGGTGSNVDCWFFLDRRVVEGTNELRLHFDAGDASNYISHGVIEPASSMKPLVFANALVATASDWVCLNHCGGFMEFLTSDRSAYQEYLMLLTQLKGLIQRNQDESEEGEVLRTQMDKLWFKIPEDKRREINRDVRLPNIHFHE